MSTEDIHIIVKTINNELHNFDVPANFPVEELKRIIKVNEISYPSNLFK
jgi:hypothetical protein